jgi:hypothetical protein
MLPAEVATSGDDERVDGIGAAETPEMLPE